jgi:hypothetical protein
MIDTDTTREGQEATMTKKMTAILMIAFASLAGLAHATTNSGPTPNTGQAWTDPWNTANNNRALLYGCDPASPSNRTNGVAADRTNGALLVENPEASNSVYQLSAALATGATVTVSALTITLEIVQKPITTTELNGSDPICVSNVSMAQAALGEGTFLYVGQPYVRRSNGYAETLYLVSLRGARSVGVRQGKK